MHTVPMELLELLKFQGDTPLATKLKLYAQVLKYLLGPMLVQQNLDRSAFDSGVGGSQKPQFRTPEPAPPATPEAMQSPAPAGSTTPNSNSDDSKEGSSQQNDSASRETFLEHEIPEDGSLPAVVVYLVEPFSFSEWSEVQRLAMVGLLRAYQQMVLPPHLHNSTFLQMVPLKTILDYQEGSAQSQALKSLAFSVFTSCRWMLNHAIMGRSLTGFGPAAGAEIFLKNKPPDPGGLMRLYSPPYILAPLKSQDPQAVEFFDDCTEKPNVFFFTYCLSHDQRFLLAACTDNRGEMLDTCIINIDIPNRNQRKKASARKHGLAKLWDYILGIVSQSTRAARIVIGRLGRMGHGELKGWSGLLGKRNLQAASRRIKEMCMQCSLSSQFPSVRSACVVSMEMNPSFQVFADMVKQEEKQSSNCPLQTPRDASVTHILVFPTSATATVNLNSLQPGDPGSAIDNIELDMFGDDVFPDDDLGQELGNMAHGMDGMDFVMDIFAGDQTFDAQPGSPLGTSHDRNRQSSRTNDPSSLQNGQGASDPQDDNNLLQQPLAMGYFLSTAPAGPLPQWMWSSCPENQFTSPVCFKAALHVNISSRQWDNEGLDHSSHNTDHCHNHPLDSHLTCDVLRFVLANYNALSWLTYDPASNDRRTCLPVHKAVLLQMYHAMQTYV